MNRRPPLFPDLPPFPKLLPGWSHASYLVLLMAIVVRSLAVLALGGQLQQDPDAYATLAENLARYGVLGSVSQVDDKIVKRPSAYRPPLYPLLLRATCVNRRGDLSTRRVAVLHVVLGVATTMLVWHVALRCGLGSWSLVAAGATLVDPLLLNQAALVMTETLAAALVAAALWFLLRREEGLARYDLAAGVTLGLAALCRPTFLAWIGLLLIYDVCRHLYRDQRDELSRTVMVGVIVVITLSPWIVRNAKQLGRATPTTTHGGYTLLLGNNPDFYRHLREAPWGTVWDSQQLDDERMQWLKQHEMDEVAADRDSYRKAWNTILEQPGMFAYSCLVRLGRFWSPIPHKLSDDESTKRKLLRWATCMWYDVMLILAVIGVAVVVRRGLSGPWLAGLVLVLTLTLVHTFFWSNMRMRAPLVPFLSLLTAAGLTLICYRDDELSPVDPAKLGQPQLPASQDEDDEGQIHADSDTIEID